MLVYVRNGRLKQFGHVPLGEPNGLVFRADFDASLTVCRLVQNELTGIVGSRYPHQRSHVSRTTQNRQQPDPAIPRNLKISLKPTLQKPQMSTSLHGRILLPFQVKFAARRQHQGCQSPALAGCSGCQISPRWLKKQKTREETEILHGFIHSSNQFALSREVMPSRKRRLLFNSERIGLGKILINSGGDVRP